MYIIYKQKFKESFKKLKKKSGGPAYPETRHVELSNLFLCDELARSNPFLAGQRRNEPKRIRLIHFATSNHHIV